MSTKPPLPTRSDFDSGAAAPTPRPDLGHTRVMFAHRAVMLAALALLLTAAGARAEPLNRVVLVVNDQIATLHDYEEQLGTRLATLNRSELDPEERRRQLERIPREVFREMLDTLLVLSRTEQLGIRMSDADVERVIEQIREANGFETQNELRQAVAQSGQTWEQFRVEVAKGARFRELVSREVRSRIQLEEDDLRRFYRDNPELFRQPEERRLREIVVLDTSGLSLGEMERLASEIRERLAAGAEPVSVLEDGSDPPRTSGVIDLDWVPKGDLDPALESAVEALAPGEWSPPVAARGGRHMIQLLERKEARMRPFDEVEDEIYAREQDRLFAREYPKYLRELEEKSYVRAEPPPEAEGFRRRRPEETPVADPLEVFRRKPGEPAAPAEPPAAPEVEAQPEAPASEESEPPP